MEIATPLILMDPALGQAGAHESVVADMLEGLEEDMPLGVIGNARMEMALRCRLSNGCELVESLFDADFFALADKHGGVGQHWDWIWQLACSYAKGFGLAMDRWPGRDLIFLHHALSWEHASALALAIRLFGGQGHRLRHIVLLMKLPGLDESGVAQSPESKLDLRISFDALRKAHGVELYAGCVEQAEAYRQLLKLQVPLPVHPRIAGERATARGRCEDIGARGNVHSGDKSRTFGNWLQGLSGPLPAGRTPIERMRASRRVSVGMETGFDVVLFWKQNDSTLYGRRNDMIARYLAARPDVRRVLVLDAPISEDRLSAMAASKEPLRHDRWIAERTLQKLSGEFDEGKLAFTVFVHPGDGYGPDEQDKPGLAFLDAYEAFLRQEFAHWGIDPGRAIFWIYPRNFSLPPLLARFSPAKVVVDVVDDHRAWPGLAEAEKTRLSEHYSDLLGRADLVLANCEPVRTAMSALGSTPQLVPNGSDEPLPIRIGNADEALREHLSFPGQTLGFIGNLEAKIDVELLSRLAAEFPDCRLVLVGSTHANPEAISLLDHPNVRMPGVVPYDRLGAWLSCFDVGLIPHRKMELTRHMNPLKAYVYLANGVPVVATSVANVQPVPGLLTVAKDADAFIAAVSDHLASGRPARERFDAFSAIHGWAARLSPHVDALTLGMAEKAGP